LLKKFLKSISKTLLVCIDDILLIIGIILLTIGTFKIFIPAGYITLGICFIAFAFFVAKKGG
jgi:predicted tellurium resistance membrane protein TerC